MVSSSVCQSRTEPSRRRSAPVLAAVVVVLCPQRQVFHRQPPGARRGHASSPSGRLQAPRHSSSSASAERTGAATLASAARASMKGAAGADAGELALERRGGRDREARGDRPAGGLAHQLAEATVGEDHGWRGDLQDLERAEPLAMNEARVRFGHGPPGLVGERTLARDRRPTQPADRSGRGPCGGPAPRRASARWSSASRCSRVASTVSSFRRTTPWDVVALVQRGSPEEAWAGRFPRALAAPAVRAPRRPGPLPHDRGAPAPLGRAPGDEGARGARAPA